MLGVMSAGRMRVGAVAEPWERAQWLVVKTEYQLGGEGRRRTKMARIKRRRGMKKMLACMAVQKRRARGPQAGEMPKKRRGHGWTLKKRERV